MQRKAALAFGLMALGIVAVVVFHRGPVITESPANNWKADELLVRAEAGVSEKCQQALDDVRQKVQDAIKEKLAPLKEKANKQCLGDGGLKNRLKCRFARKAYNKAIEKAKEKIEQDCVNKQQELVCWSERKTCIPKSCEDEKDAIKASVKARQQGKDCE